MRVQTQTLNQEYGDTSDIRLIEEIKNGSGDAFGILAERYNYIISYNLSKIGPQYDSGTGTDREDLFQECRIILYKAAKYYDFMKNVKFSTYANICIKNYLVSIRRKYGRVRKYAEYYDFIPLDEIRGNESEAAVKYDSYFAAGDFYPLPERFLGALSAFERKVLTMYIENRSYKYMADILKKSVKSIDNAVTRIKLKLRPYAKYFISE